MVTKWTLVKFELGVCGIEEDLLKKKALPHIQLVTSGADVASRVAEEGPSKGVVTVDDRTLTSCGVNAIVMALAVTADEKHGRLLAGIVIISDAILEWHGHQSRSCRSVEGNKAWLLEQPGGAAMQQISDIIDSFEVPGQLRGNGVLDRCGL